MKDISESVCVCAWPLIIGQWIRCIRLSVYISRWTKLKVVIKRLELGGGGGGYSITSDVIICRGPCDGVEHIPNRGSDRRN